MYNPNLQILVVGNKADIVSNNPSKREVEKIQGAKLGREYKCKFIEYSFEERSDNLISKLLSNKIPKETTTGVEEEIKLERP